MNTEILSMMFFPSIGIAIGFWVGVNVVIFIVTLILASYLKIFNGETFENELERLWMKAFTKIAQLALFAVCLTSAIFLLIESRDSFLRQKIAETYFSSLPQRIAASLPFASSEKDRIAVKIDELMDLEKTLGSRKLGTVETATAFEASISKRLSVLPSLSQKGKDFEASLIGQEREYLAKAKKETETLTDALTEVNYLKEYAKNRYAELGNDQAKTDVIGRIGDFTSKFH